MANRENRGGGCLFSLSTRTSLKLIVFSLFLVFSMVVLASVVAWSAGNQNVSTPITMEYSAKIKLTFANYEGSVVTPSNCEVVMNDDETKFKIVGPTPILTSTTSSTSTNGSNSERTAMNGAVATSTSNTLTANASSGPTGKISAITDLANSSGAEFYYFCTNSAVTSSTGYTDPGTIYWTSTADTTLETWYDNTYTVDNPLQLYSCFMIPNYDGTTFTGVNSLIISNTVTCVQGSATNQTNCIGGKQAMDSNNNAILNNIENVVIPNSVSAIGEYAFVCFGMSDIIIPNSVKSFGYGSFGGCALTSLNIPNGLTSIGPGAFYGCKGLTGNLIIPSNVVSIGDYAFQYCTGLTNVTFSEGIESIGNCSFDCCIGLTSIVIPASMTVIGQEAFSRCVKVMSISVDVGNTKYYSSSNCLIETSTRSLLRGCHTSSIPDNISKIASYAFYACTGLSGTLTIPRYVSVIGERAFEGCTNITSIDFTKVVNPLQIRACAFAGCTGLTGELLFPNSLYAIGIQAFYACKGLTGDLVIPSKVTYVGARAFENCEGIESLDLSCDRIEEFAFSCCSGLKSVTFQDGVEEIKLGAFDCCTFTKIDIPASVTTIEEGAFSRCSNISAITVASENQYYYVSNSCLIERSTQSLLRGCNNSSIPSDIKIVGAHAFYGCTNLSGTLTIPESVTKIGENAFRNCSGLTGTLTIPSSVKSIGDSAFEKCTGITGLDLGTGVEEIGLSAFRSCWGLRGALTIPNSVSTLGAGAFYDCYNLSGVLTISSNLTSIKEQTFEGCKGITEVTIPDSVKSIGKGAFQTCHNLTNVIIGSGVEYIGACVFNSCDDLTSVAFKDTSYKWNVYSGSTIELTVFSSSDPTSFAYWFKKGYSYCEWFRES